MMDALLNISWPALASMGMVCALCGWALRHLQGRAAERAAGLRIAALCDQLDAKDAKLQELRIELQLERAQALELQAAGETRQALSALRLEENEDPAFFRRLVRAL
jgi:hypothetical protein